MTTTEPSTDPSSTDDLADEARLLAAARDGSAAAFGQLYARYRPFAVGVATRALASSHSGLAEDVADVAFMRVLSALRNGKGPSDVLRAYLTTTVRREAWRAQRRHQQQAEVADRWSAEVERSTETDSFAARSATLGGHALLHEAFGSLSDRWRTILWMTEVEGRKPAEVAPLFGLSAGSVSALAYRARNGLVTAYLDAYQRAAVDGGCASISKRLGRYVAAGYPSAGFADVVAHLGTCRSCREVSRGVDVSG